MDATARDRGPRGRSPSRARGVAAAVFASFLGACSTMPPSQETYYFDEAAMAALPGTPMIEYPPLEPVQAPPPIEPTPVAPPKADPPPAAGNPAPAGGNPEPPTGNPASADGVAGGATGPAPSVPGAPVAQERVTVATLAPELRSPAPAPPPPDYELLALMADLDRYSGYAPDDAKREIPAMTQAFNRERNDVNRVRLAMLYTLTRAPQDDLRALQLLDNVAKSGGPQGPVKHLAVVLQVQVSERTRAVRDEAARANEAAQKLEALRQMERSLLRDRISSGGGGGGGGGSGGGH